MASLWKQGLLVAAVGLALTACSNGKTDTNGTDVQPGKDAPSASQSAASPSASSEAKYVFDLQAEGTMPPPEGTTLLPLDPNSPIYVPSDNPVADVHVEFNLDRKGDFIVVSGKGNLTVSGKSVPFTIDQLSVVREEKLSDGQTFVLGGLQADDKADPSTFAFGFRFLPDAQELQLLLSNGESLVAFGGGDELTEHAAEIEKLEAENRQKP